MTKDKNNNVIDMLELEEFLKLHPISFNEIVENPYDKSNHYGILLQGFYLWKEKKIDIIKEYKDVSEAIRHYSEYEFYAKNSSNFGFGFQNKLIESLTFLKNYSGYWNIETTLKNYGITNKSIEKMIEDIKNDFPYDRTVEKEKKEKEQEKFIELYYKKEIKLNDTDLQKEVKKVKDHFEVSKFDKDFIDITKVKYPVIIAFYKDNKLVSLKKCTKALDLAISTTKKNLEFDKYSYIYLNEDIIYDVAANFMLNNKIINTNISLIHNSCRYKTLNSIKQRYKCDNRVDLRVIKKIIKIYELPFYTLQNGMQVTERDRFDESLKMYFGEN